MATYHFNRQWISRFKRGADVGSSSRVVQKPTSIVRAAAYRAADILPDQLYGGQHNFSRKHVIDAQIILPDGASEEFLSREHLWNSVDLAEKRYDAVLAMEDEFALPRELDHAQHASLVEAYIREEFTSRSLAAEYAIHDETGANPHVHILVTTRAVEGDRLGARKAEYARGGPGAKLRLLASRKAIADHVNAALEGAGLDQRVSEASYRSLGFPEFKPSTHRGWASNVKSLEAKRRQRLQGAAATQEENGAKLLADPELALRMLRAARNVFSWGELEDFVALHSAPAQQEKVLDRIRHSEQLVLLNPYASDGEHLFTHASTLSVEKSLVADADALFRSKVSRPSGKILGGFELAVSGKASESVVALARGLLDGRRLQVLDSAAPADVAEAVAMLNQSFRRHGRRIVYVAPNAAAAKEAKERFGAWVTTPMSLAHRLRTGGDLEEGKVYVLGSAELVPNDVLATLLTGARKHNASVCLSGSSDSIHAFRYAGGFAKLLRRFGSVEARSEHKDPIRQRALNCLRGQAGTEALAVLKEAGQYVEVEFAQEAMGAVIDGVLAEACSRPGAHHVAVVGRWQRDAVTERIRAGLKELGVLGGGKTVPLTAGDDRLTRSLEPLPVEVAVGDWLRAERSDRSLGLRRGVYLKVVAVDEDTLGLVEKSGVRHVINLSEYRSFSHAYTQTLHEAVVTPADSSQVLLMPAMKKRQVMAAVSSAPSGSVMYASRQEFGEHPSVGAAVARDDAPRLSIDFLQSSVERLRRPSVSVRVQSMRSARLRAYLKARKVYAEARSLVDSGVGSSEAVASLESARRGLELAIVDVRGWCRMMVQAAGASPRSVDARVRRSPGFLKLESEYRESVESLSATRRQLDELPKGMVRGLEFFTLKRTEQKQRRICDRLLRKQRSMRHSSKEKRHAKSEFKREQRSRSVAETFLQTVSRLGLDIREAEQYIETEPQVLSPEVARAAPRASDLQASGSTLAGALVSLRERGSTFSKGQLLLALCEQGRGIDEVERDFNQGLRSGSIVALGGSPSGARSNVGPSVLDGLSERFAAAEVIRCEEAYCSNLADLASQKGYGIAQAVLADAQKSLAFDLNADQKRILADLAKDSGFCAIEGSGGVGKSALLAAANRAWVAEGRDVVGVAMSGKAVCGLRDSAGIQSSTAAALIQRARKGELLPAGSVLVADEAGMLATDSLAELSLLAKRSGAKLVLTGDTEQLPPIGPSGGFEFAVRRYAPPAITTVIRQKDKGYREAIGNLWHGRILEGMRQLKKLGVFRLRSDSESCIEAMVKSYVSEGLDTGTLMLAHRRVDVLALNAGVRDGFKRSGMLADARNFEVGTGSMELALGDRVLFTKNEPQHGVFNGNRGRVHEITADHVTIKLENGEMLSLSANALPEMAYGYAVSIHKSQSMTVDRVSLLYSRRVDSRLNYTALSRLSQSGSAYVPNDAFASFEALVESVSRRPANSLAISYPRKSGDASVRDLEVIFAKAKEHFASVKSYRRGLHDDSVAPMLNVDVRRLVSNERHVLNLVGEAIARRSVHGSLGDSARFDAYVSTLPEYLALTEQAEALRMNPAEKPDKVLRGVLKELEELRASARVRDGFALYEIRSDRSLKNVARELTTLLRLRAAILAQSAERRSRIEKLSQAASDFVRLRSATPSISSEKGFGLIRDADQALRQIADALVHQPCMAAKVPAFIMRSVAPYTRARRIIEWAQGQVSAGNSDFAESRSVAALLAQARAANAIQHRLLPWVENSKSFLQAKSEFARRLEVAKGDARREVLDDRDRWLAAAERHLDLWLEVASKFNVEIRQKLKREASGSGGVWASSEHASLARFVRAVASQRLVSVAAKSPTQNRKVEVVR